MSKNKETCFVIMPFTKTTEEHTEDYWTKHFETFLKPLIEENQNFEARRSEALRGDILRQIITDLVVSRIVVAELTDYNPNVFWELGVRQSFKHGTITIAEDGTKLPFDIGGKGTLFYYPKDHIKMQTFRNTFKRAIKDCLDHPDRADTHVLETLSGRGTLFEIFRKDEAIRRLDALNSEYSRNKRMLEFSIETAERNQKDPENRNYASGRFSFSSVELLITNRYIEEDQSFYKLSEEYLTNIIRLNSALNEWFGNSDRIENWLLKNKDDWIRLFNEFRESIEKAYEKLRIKY